MLVIGIKRRFFLGYKKYKVESFYFRKSVKVKDLSNTLQDETAIAEIDMWLVLLCTNGRDIIIPQIEKKQWYIKDLSVIKAKKVKPQLKEAQNGLQISKSNG